MEMTKEMQKVVGKSILDLPMQENDAEAKTVGDYLRGLLRSVWIEEESFDGKRPFGNSGWQQEIYAALVTSEFIVGDLEKSPYDYEEADSLVLLAIDEM